MMIFSAVLFVLLFATPNADAQRCHRWNSCYKKSEQKENSALQASFMKINQKLLAQRKTVELLEKGKGNSFDIFIIS